MIASTVTTCNCWDETDKALRKQGFAISDQCSGLALNKQTLSLTARYFLPLKRVDGQRLRRDDPKTINITHCPFCGKALTEETPN